MAEVPDVTPTRSSRARTPKAPPAAKPAAPQAPAPTRSRRTPAAKPAAPQAPAPTRSRRTPAAKPAAPQAPVPTRSRRTPAAKPAAPTKPAARSRAAKVDAKVAAVPKPAPAPRRGRTKPQKNAAKTTVIKVEDFESDDEVTNYRALKTRAAEMLARPDIHERDWKSIAVEYRWIMTDLREAVQRAEAKKLGKQDGAGAGPPVTISGDI